MHQHPRDHLTKKQGIDNRLSQYQGVHSVKRKTSAHGEEALEGHADAGAEHEPEGGHEYEEGHELEAHEHEGGNDDTHHEDGDEHHDDAEQEHQGEVTKADLNLPEDWVEAAKRQAAERAEEERKRKEAEDLASQELRAEEARKRLEEEEARFLEQAEEQKRKAEEAKIKREREAVERRKELAEKAAAEAKAERAAQENTPEAIAKRQALEQEDKEKAKRKARVAEIMARAKAAKSSNTPTLGLVSRDATESPGLSEEFSGNDSPRRFDNDESSHRASGLSPVVPSDVAADEPQPVEVSDISPVSQEADQLADAILGASASTNEESEVVEVEAEVEATQIQTNAESDIEAVVEDEVEHIEEHQEPEPVALAADTFIPAPADEEFLDDAPKSADLSTGLADFVQQEQAVVKEEEELSRQASLAPTTHQVEVTPVVESVAPVQQIEEQFDGFGNTEAPAQATLRRSFNPFEAKPVDADALWSALEASHASAHTASASEEAQWARLLQCA